jgi:hypothetical protein
MPYSLVETLCLHLQNKLSITAVKTQILALQHINTLRTGRQLIDFLAFKRGGLGVN